jgi:predicted amidohydrolase
MRVAIVQVASPDDETQRSRIERVETILRSRPDADLLVLPELWSAGYFNFDRYAELSETLDGPTISMCSRVAADLGVAVHAGSIIERDGAGRLRNTSVLIDDQGHIAHTYSKIHVFGYQSREAELLSPGNTLAVANTQWGRVSSTTCYDLRFPALWGELSRRETDIVLVPAAWPAARREHWKLLTSARAVENQMFVIACNAAGIQNGVELGGHSRIIDPSGAIVVECGDAQEVAVVDIDPTTVGSIRREFPVLADRLPSYSGLNR